MTMKKAILVLILISTILAPNVKAQETIINEVNYNQLETFIQMAKDYYPKRKILVEQESKAKNSISSSNVSYLDLFNVNYFYRPDDQATLNPQNPYLTNGFQFGINLNLGNFLQKPFQVKDAKSDLKIAQFEKEAYDIDLTKEVKNRYYNYILQSKELKLKTLTVQDSYDTFRNLTAQFERGEITIEDYNAARTAMSEANSSKIQTEMNFIRAKDDLEEIIGVELTELKTINNQN